MIQHLIPVLLIQAAITLLLRNYLAGAASGSSWAISREIAQAEYRWIEQFGGGLRANMPWWGGLDHRVWLKLDPWLDWIVPTIIGLAIALAAQRLNSQKARTTT